MNKIYKKLLVAAGAVAMLFQAAPASAAPTLDQLTGSDMMYYGTLFRAYDRGECIPFINQDITIEKVGANSVIFRNFYNEGSYVYDLPATYDENKGAFTVNYNTQFYKSGTTTPCGRYFRKFNKNTWLWRTPVGSYSYNFEQDWFPNWDQSAVVATVTPFDGLEGGYHIRFETWAIDDNGVNLNSSTHEYDYSSLYVIMAYPANAIVSDEYYRTTTSATNPIAKRTYTVNVSFSNPTNFNIVNFCEQGAGFDNFDWDNMSPYVKYDVNIDGQINADGTVSLGNLRGDDDMRNAFSLGQNLVYRNRRGTLYFVYNGYVYTGASNVNTLMDHYYYKGIPNDYNGDVTENITGTWHYGDIYHNNYGNGWAKYVNGGTCETRTGDMIINLDPYVLVYGSDVSTKTKDTDWVKNTQITYPGGNDITFNAIVNPKISHKASDTDSEGLGLYRFNVSVSDFVNTENVESVEVYYIEGAHNHCSSVNHSNAVKMGTIKSLFKNKCE